MKQLTFTAAASVLFIGVILLEIANNWSTTNGFDGQIAFGIGGFVLVIGGALGLLLAWYVDTKSDG